MHLLYLAILAACLIGTLPLELVLHVHVYARWRRLAMTLLPVVVIFGGWDVLAIRAHQWHYDAARLVGLTLPGDLPVEELLFFLVVPICSVLAFEAVRVSRPRWSGAHR